MKLPTHVVKLLCLAKSFFKDTKIVSSGIKVALARVTQGVGGGIALLCSSSFSEMDCSLGRKGSNKQGHRRKQEENILSCRAHNLSATSSAS
jgi:hypothetical protein